MVLGSLVTVTSLVYVGNTVAGWVKAFRTNGKRDPIAEVLKELQRSNSDIRVKTKMNLDQAARIDGHVKDVGAAVARVDRRAENVERMQAITLERLK